MLAWPSICCTCARSAPCSKALVAAVDPDPEQATALLVAFRPEEGDGPIAGNAPLPRLGDQGEQQELAPEPLPPVKPGVPAGEPEATECLELQHVDRVGRGMIAAWLGRDR